MNYIMSISPSFLSENKKILVDDTNNLITDRAVFLSKKYFSVVIEHDDDMCIKSCIERTPLLEPWKFFSQSLKFGLLEKTVYQAYFTALCYETTNGMTSVIVVPEIHQVFLVPHALKTSLTHKMPTLFYNTTLYHLYIRNSNPSSQELLGVCLPFSINTQSVFSEVLDVVSLHAAPIIDPLHPPLNKRLF